MRVGAVSGAGSRDTLENLKQEFEAWRADNAKELKIAIMVNRSIRCVDYCCLR